VIHILYVPKDKNVEDFYEEARKHNCRQIVHGNSDLIKDRIDDFSQVSVVLIPESVYMMMSQKVIPEGETVFFRFINEFVSDMKEREETFIKIEKMYENETLLDQKMKYDGAFAYDYNYKFDSYGEFSVKVYGLNKFNREVILCEDEIIVYKKQESLEEVFKFDD
jgi:hypothetical protein